MPRAISRPRLAQKFCDEVQSRVEADAIGPTEVEWEPIRGTKMIRLWAIAPGFAQMGMTERERWARRCAEALAPEERIRVLIHPVTPEESRFWAPLD